MDEENLDFPINAYVNVKSKGVKFRFTINGIETQSKPFKHKEVDLIPKIAQKLIIWDCESRVHKYILPFHGSSIVDVAWHPFKNISASAGSDRYAVISEITETDAERLLTLYGHIQPLTNIIFNSDGNKIISASLDGTIKLWDSVTGDELYNLSFDRNGISSISIDKNCNYIFSFIAYCTVYL